MTASDSKNARKEFLKQEKPLMVQNALKNVRHSVQTLTEHWLCILRDECLNRIPRTEFNVRQAFLAIFGDSTSNKKYGNYLFSLLFFILQENGKEFCKTEQIRSS